MTDPPTTPAPTLAERSGITGRVPEPASRDLLFDDDMTDPSSGWQQLDEDFATISYDSGVLAFRYNQNQSWAYTVRQILDAEHDPGCPLPTSRRTQRRPVRPAVRRLAHREAVRRGRQHERRH